MKPQKHFTVGIDLGGTKVAIGAVSQSGKLLRQYIVPTSPGVKLTPAKHVDYVVGAIVHAIEQLKSGLPGELKGVGLASAGPMNVDTGVLINPSNFKGWKKVAIRSALEKRMAARGLEFKVAFQNDAMAAALGEGWVGAAQKWNTYAMITVGTGIGSGVILNGKPVQSSGMGSEWGHSLVVPFDPSRDIYHSTVEGLASGTGIKLRAAPLGVETTQDLVKLAKKKNPNALEIFNDASYALASLYFNLSIGFKLDGIVVGGGLLKIGQYFYPQSVAIYKELMKRQFTAFRCPIVTAKLDNSAGLMGAAQMAWEQAQ